MPILFADADAGKEGSDGASSVRPYVCASRDPRALRIIAKTVYRELRQGGLAEEDMMAVASELLSLVAGDMKDRRAAEQPPAPPLPTRR